MSSLFEALGGDYDGSPCRRRLTAVDVADIRHLYHQSGWKQAELAERFGVTQPQISKIVNNKQWKDGT